MGSVGRRSGQVAGCVQAGGELNRTADARQRLLYNRSRLGHEPGGCVRRVKGVG